MSGQGRTSASNRSGVDRLHHGPPRRHAVVDFIVDNPGLTLLHGHCQLCIDDGFVLLLRDA
jgi:hypothetical protein